MPFTQPEYPSPRCSMFTANELQAVQFFGDCSPRKKKEAVSLGRFHITTIGVVCKDPKLPAPCLKVGPTLRFKCMIWSSVIRPGLISKKDNMLA